MNVRFPYGRGSFGAFSTVGEHRLLVTTCIYYLYGVVFQRTFGVVFQRAGSKRGVVFQRDLSSFLSTKVWCFSGCFRRGVVFQRGKLCRSAGVMHRLEDPSHPLDNAGLGVMEGAHPRISSAPIVDLTSSSGQQSLSLAISRSTSFRKFCTVVLSSASDGSAPNWR